MPLPQYVPRRITLYDDDDGQLLLIDQDRDDGTNDTMFETNKDNFNFNKPLISSNDFKIVNGPHLSWLTGFTGVTDNIKTWVESQLSTLSSSLTGSISNELGANTFVVSPNHMTLDTALAAVTVDNSIIKVLPGAYTVGSSVILPNFNITIIGGEHTCITAGNNLVSIFTGGHADKSYTFKNITFENCLWAIEMTAGNLTCEDVCIQNAGWDGVTPLVNSRINYQLLFDSNTVSPGGGIHLSSANEFKFNNLNIKDSHQGIKIDSVNSKASISNSKIINCLFDAISFGTNQNTDITCNRITINNCQISCNRGFGIKAEGTDKLNIVNTVFEDNYNSALLLLSSYSVESVGNVFVRNNIQNYNGQGNLVPETKGTVSINGGDPNNDVDTIYLLNASGCTFSCGGSGSESDAYALFVENIDKTVNVSGCGYICFDETKRANDLSAIVDAQLSWITSQLHALH